MDLADGLMHGTAGFPGCKRDVTGDQEVHSTDGGFRQVSRFFKLRAKLFQMDGIHDLESGFNQFPCDFRLDVVGHFHDSRSRIVAQHVRQVSLIRRQEHTYTPLAQQPGSPKDFGDRHRADLGFDVYTLKIRALFLDDPIIVDEPGSLGIDAVFHHLEVFHQGLTRDVRSHYLFDCGAPRNGQSLLLVRGRVLGHGGLTPYPHGLNLRDRHRSPRGERVKQHEQRH